MSMFFSHWNSERDHDDDYDGFKMFSDCSGECCVCGCSGGCLAGHGDDDFYPASERQLQERLMKYPEGSKERRLIESTLKDFEK